MKCVRRNLHGIPKSYHIDSIKSNRRPLNMAHGGFPAIFTLLILNTKIFISMEKPRTI